MTASAAVTVCALAATALILRVLPRAEAGRFALLVELLYALGVLGTLGQATLQARLYQQAPAGHFDWWRDCDPLLSITFPALALAVAFLAIPYGLTSFEFVFLVIGVGTLRAHQLPQRSSGAAATIRVVERATAVA